jgi:hypothetical protein
MVWYKMVKKMRREKRLVGKSFANSLHHPQLMISMHCMMGILRYLLSSDDSCDLIELATLLNSSSSSSCRKTPYSGKAIRVEFSGVISLIEGGEGMSKEMSK